MQDIAQVGASTFPEATAARLSNRQIINLCCGLFGVQIVWGLQNANTSRIFQTLGAKIDDLPILWIAGPIAGLLVQPIIGEWSDRTTARWGRRRPFMTAGAPTGVLGKHTAARNSNSDDVDPATAQFMANSQVPWGVNALSGKVTVPAWKSKPSYYLVASDDHMIPPPAQRAMAKRAGATVVETAGSHAVYVSKPGDVARLIEQAATATK